MDLLSFDGFHQAFARTYLSETKEEYMREKAVLNKYVDFASYMGDANKETMKINKAYKNLRKYVLGQGKRLGVY